MSPGPAPVSDDIIQTVKLLAMLMARRIQILNPSMTSHLQLWHPLEKLTWTYLMPQVAFAEAPLTR
jgi:hypothetical protein